MKTKFKVYITETIEYSYDVEAETVAEAESKVMEGDYDESTYEVYDSYDSQIVDVDEVIEDE
jgi:hypothetical protein